MADQEKKVSELTYFEMSEILHGYGHMVENTDDGIRLTTSDGHTYRLQDERHLRSLILGIRLGRHAALAAVFRLPS